MRQESLTYQESVVLDDITMLNVSVNHEWGEAISLPGNLNP